MSVPRSASPKSSGSPSAAPRWRTWLFRGALLALGLVVGVGVPYFYVLDKRVRAEFEALVWQVPDGQPPVTLQTMAQISYRNPRAKVYSAHPQPTECRP